MLNASPLDRIAAALSSLRKRKAPEEDDNRNRTSPTVGSAPPSKRTSFRPWDQKELLRRLETYRPLTWFAKPECASAVACASRGWVNEARDTLCCEFCAVKLIYPQVPFEARAKAAAMFAEQLISKHTAHCPWRSTCCDEEVLSFVKGSAAEVSPDALAASFAQRLTQLRRIEDLPPLHADALGRIASALGGGPTALQQLLAALPGPKPAAIIAAVAAASADGDAAAAGGGSSSSAPQRLSLVQRAQLLALLGWEADQLQSSAAAISSSIGSPASRGAASASVAATSATAPAGADGSCYSLVHLMGSKAPKPATAPVAGGDVGVGLKRISQRSAVLSCPMCKSRVGLWNYMPPPQQPAAVAVKLGHTIAGGAFSGAAPAAAAAGAAASPVQRPARFGARFGTSDPVFGLAALPTAAPQQQQQPAAPAAVATPAASSLKRKLPEGTPAAAAAGAPMAPPAASVPATPARGHTAATAAAAAAEQTPCQPITQTKRVRIADTPLATPSGPATSATPGLQTPGAAATAAAAAATPGTLALLSPRTAAAVNEVAATGAGGAATAAPEFDFMGYHRSWCPYVFTGTPTASTTPRFKCGWATVADALAQAASGSASGAAQGADAAGGAADDDYVDARAGITAASGAADASGDAAGSGVDVQGLRRKIADALKRM